MQFTSNIWIYMGIIWCIFYGIYEKATEPRTRRIFKYATIIMGGFIIAALIILKFSLLK